MDKLVLVIDDEESVRMALKNRLTKLGCNVIEAIGLDDAKKYIKKYKNSLNLVILDLRLLSPDEEEGEESGLKILQENLGPAKKCDECGFPRIKTNVILLTAYPSVASCRAAFLSGVFDYISKTSPSDFVIERIKEALK